MKSFIHNAALALLLAAVAPAAFGNGGTIPLRLGNGGTNPLRMNGNAISMNGVQQVPAQMAITQVTRAEMSPAQGATLVCQIAGQNVSKHAAQGTVAVDSGNYTVKGICFNHDNNAMEIVAERGAGQTLERTYMTGPLLVEEPRSFAGRLVVNGSSPHSGRYNFDIRCPEGRRDDGEGHYELVPQD